MITKQFSLGKIPENLPGCFPFSNTISFLDIESTGYARKNASLAYAGCLFPKNGCWIAALWITETKKEETALLSALFAKLSSCTALVTFGGTSFDLPFLKKKASALGLSFPLSDLSHLDLYQAIRPFQKFFGLEHMDQKSLEHLLGLVRSPEDNDLTMLPKLLPLLSFLDLKNGSFQEVLGHPVADPKAFQYQLSITLPFSLPFPISHMYEHFYLKGEGNQVQLLVYGFSGTLKYFFQDYKNYYYLPAEDQAIHKSVAAYMDKKNRVPAKASTCYIKKSGNFLPSPAVGTYFLSEWKASDAWLLYTPDWEANPENLQSYARFLLSFL